MLSCSRRGLELYKGQRPKSMLTPQLPLSSIKHALRVKIEQDLERLEREGTIEPVQYSEWPPRLSVS